VWDYAFALSSRSSERHVLLRAVHLGCVSGLARWSATLVRLSNSGQGCATVDRRETMAILEFHEPAHGGVGARMNKTANNSDSVDAVIALRLQSVHSWWRVTEPRR